MGKCKTCGRGADGDYCFQHKPRKMMKAKTMPKGNSWVYITNKIGKKQIEEAKRMKLFFLKVWNKRPHKSEVSGEYLSADPSSAYFHHILEKSKYPELAYIEENIILLTLDEHATVESDIYAYALINIKRENLKDKYLKPRENE
jgi:hypothetical protein